MMDNQSSPTHTPGSTQRNVDPREIEKFSAIASKWWDTEGEFKPLHQINPLRVTWITDIVGDLSGKQVLDVGCGGGILAESLAKAGAEVTGIDLAKKSLTVARLHALEAQLTINYRHIAVEEMAQAHPAQYDVVTCLEMLEHVPNPHSIISACAQLVKPGGWVFFSTINRNPKSFFQAIVAAEYLLRIVPRGTHDHSLFLKPSELRRSIEANGLAIRDITGLTFNPLSQTYRLVDDASVNYMMAAQK